MCLSGDLSTLGEPQTSCDVRRYFTRRPILTEVELEFRACGVFFAALKFLRPPKRSAKQVRFRFVKLYASIQFHWPVTAGTIIPGGRRKMKQRIAYDWLGAVGSGFLVVFLFVGCTESPQAPPDKETPKADPSIASVLNRMGEIVIGLHRYHDTHRQFPPVCSTGEDGKQLLS